MADKLTYLETNNEFNNVSRYQVLRVIEQGKETYLESYNQLLVPKSDADLYHVVQHSEVNRLDIIANNYYGNPAYYWILALANGFIDPFIVNEGTMIRIPDLLTVNDATNKILNR